MSVVVVTEKRRGDVGLDRLPTTSRLSRGGKVGCMAASRMLHLL